MPLLEVRCICGYVGDISNAERGRVPSTPSAAVTLPKAVDADVFLDLLERDTVSQVPGVAVAPCFTGDEVGEGVPPRMNHADTW